MATRQYIGARYVPKFYQNSVDGSANWQSNVVYEPLTYVTLTNGHMYISKKQVPATVGSPASNIDYWLDVGSYNGFIEELQQEIDGLEVKIDDVEKEVNFDDAKILLITDSYGLSVDSAGKHIDELLAPYLPNATIERLSVGGAGMADGEFITPINNYSSASAATIDIVVYVGGANDVSQASLNPSDLITGIDNFWNAVKAKFVNCKKMFTFGCGTIFHQYSTYYYPVYRRRVAEQYAKGAIRNGATYIKNAEYILRNSALLNSDRTHPNSNGLHEMAWQLAEGLKTGGVHVHYELLITGTNLHDTGTTPAGATFYMVRDNGIVRIVGAGGSGRLYMSTENIECNPANEITLATMPDSLVDGQGVTGYDSFNMMGTVFAASENSVVRAGIQIYKPRDDAETKLTARISAPYGSITGLLQLDGTPVFID